MFDPQSLYTTDEATDHMVELVKQIEFDSLSDSTVSDNKHLQLAQAHGLGYLTGMAEGLLSATTVSAAEDENYTCALWEADMMIVINLCLLAIVSNRLSSGIHAEEETPLPSVPAGVYIGTIKRAA